MTREQRKIQALKAELLDLGPMLPGSLSEQWNVCGTPGCQCKDPKRPVRHGPYYQLSFSVGGRSSSFFVKKEDLAEARRRIRRYQRFKQLCTELTRAYVQLTRQRGFSSR
jgi:hypothetical protein